jgi:hypothetical protein
VVDQAAAGDEEVAEAGAHERPRGVEPQ